MNRSKIRDERSHRRVPLRHDQLLAQHGDLGAEISPRPNERLQEMKQQGDEVEHPG
jgi:hypothetical protein